ncbi:hypothetical protein ACSBR1_010243 [Camellia fascicularis]
MHVSVCKFGHQACGHQFSTLGFSLPEGISVQGQSFEQNSVEGTVVQFCSYLFWQNWAEMLHTLSGQEFSSRAVSVPLPEVEIPEATPEIDLPVVRIDQGKMAGVEEMMRQMQEAMKIMQEDTARQAEFAKQQAAIMAQQAELITRLQQQNEASASHQAPPPPGIPTLGETANVQEGTGIPTGPAPPPILPQLSKAPTPINQPDSPFEFEVDPTALKLNKLEKLFKKSQGVKSILDIEDGYTDAVVTLPDRFKMPQIDRFNGSGDPMVHLRLFSDILRPMGLTRLQKLSLFGRTLSGVAAIWYAKLEDDV